MHQIPSHFPVARRMRRALLVTFAAVVAIFPPGAQAASYWWTGTPAAGTNGFAFTSADAPYWNPWSSRCESRGATIPAGNPCVLTWHVPPHLDARAGSISGTYRQANPNFEQHNHVECNGTVVLQGTTTVQGFQRSWPDMCNYLSVAVVTPTPTTVTAGSQWFDATSMTVELVDPHVPGLNLLEGHGGWKGTAGACIRYGFGEAGSGIQATSLANLTTGQVHDSPSWASTAMVTGVTQTDRRPCVAPPGSGTFTFRVAASDRSGNATHHDFAVSFDVTPPQVGVPHADGSPVDDGRRLAGSTGGYHPTFTATASDAHAGLARVQVLLDGVVVAEGGSWRPAADLAPGAHVIAFRATDQLGNESVASRTFTVVDDVAPTLALDAPGGSGGSKPVLDVTATDDATGIDHATWNVRVNGELVVAASDTRRLLTDLGMLVDGRHELEVAVADRAGNPTVVRTTYVADSGDGLPDPPSLDGLFVFDSPTRVEEGDEVVVRAFAVRRGRPVAGRFELRRGDELLAEADAAPSGLVQVRAVVDAAGQLTLRAPEDAGLEPASIDFEFVPRPVDPCITQPLAPGCQPSDPGGGGSGSSITPATGPGAGGSTSGATGPSVVVNVPPAAAVPAATAAHAGGGSGPGYPRNVVYYVGGVPYWNGIPLAESGAHLDRVPPSWRMSLLRERAGVVRRTGRIALRVWTNEMTVLSLAPRGGVRRISVNPRRKLRTIHVKVDRRSTLGRRISAMRPGRTVVVRMVVTATDKNENRTMPRQLTFRVRV